MALSTGEIVAIFGGQALFLGFAGWLVKALVGHWMSKDLGEHQQQLRDASELSIAELQSRWDRDRLQFQIQFGSIFQKQAEALAELHRRLVAFEKCAQKLSRDHDQSAATFDRWVEADERMRDFYLDNEILFEPELTSLLDEFSDGWEEALEDYFMRQGYVKDADIFEKSEIFHSYWTEKQPALDKIKMTLVDHFRAKLGVKDQVSKDKILP